MKKSLFKSSLIFASLTFLSRILGLVRDQIIAIFYGANLYTDAFFVAFKIPNFFRRLFGESAFAQVFVPILAEAKKNNQLKLVINVIGTKFFTLLLLITLLLIIFSPIFIMIFAWGYFINDDPTKYNLASEMLKITGAYLLFISITAFSGSIFNFHEKYSIQSFTPVLLNVTLILFILFFYDNFESPVFALAWGVFFGGILQFLFQIPFLYKLRLIPSFKWISNEYTKKFYKRIIPTLFGVSITQVNIFIDLVIATFLVSGSVTWLYYSDRFMELPLAIIGISISTVSLTKLSFYFAEKDDIEFSRIINVAIKYVLIFSIPSLIGLVFLAEPIIFSTIQYKSFSVNDAILTSESLVAYSLGLLGFATGKIFITAYVSQGDTRTPVIAAFFAMIVNLVLSISLSNFIGHTGLALATSVSGYVNCLILYKLLDKRSEIIIRWNFSYLPKILIASSIMTLVIFFLKADTSFYIESDFFDRISELFINISIPGLVYFLILKYLGIDFRK